ncbi:MAG: fungal-specific transcription factor domain-containing protein [Benjaminiella poitrasii]|nr:MAG: fungal-specific transcription factor domain-containing protein [Benjaminiella poitrasii]
MNSIHHFTTTQQTQATNSDANNSLVTPANLNLIPLKRTRAKRSCDFCRKRKSRCDADNSIPCSNCRAWGYTCEFQTVRKKRGPPSVYVDNLEKKCKKMESLLVALTNCSIKDLEKNDFQHSGHVHSVSFSNPSDSSSDEDDENDFDPGQDQTDQQQRLIKKDYDSMKYSGQSSAGFSLLNSDIFKTHTSIPWPGREDIVLKLMSQDELMIVRTEKSPTTGKSDMLLDVGLSMSTPLFKDNSRTNQLYSPLHTSKKPARHQLDKVIGLYFSHLHTTFPIVNKKKFLEQYHNTIATGPLSILIQSVLAVTFRFVGQRLPTLVKDANEFGDFYFKKVMKRLRDHARSRLCHVQAALLMALYLDMDDGDVESIQWCTVGSAIRMAQDLGLHRSCAKWNIPRCEIETRHRVFYACYVMDRWLGTRTGKPLTILDRDFDTEMPSPYEIVDEDNNGTANTVQDPPIYRGFIAMIKLSEILGRVLKALYAPNAKLANSNAGLDDPTILAVFERRLENWKTSLDEPLDGVYFSELDKVNLNLYYNTVVLLLHRPFNQLSTTKYPNLKTIVTASEKACTNAANQISQNIHQRQYYKSDPAYYHPLCIPSLYIYSLFQACLVYLYNALRNKCSENLQALNQSINLLKINSDIEPAPRAAEILNMLISINDLHTVDNNIPIKEEANTTVSPTPTLPSTICNTPSTSTSMTRTASPSNNVPIQDHTNSSATYIQSNNYADQSRLHLTELPKTQYVQHRMMNTSIIGGITPDIQSDIGIFMARSMPHEHRQQQPVNMYLQNYPMYNNNGNRSNASNDSHAFTHHRSISLDQLNGSHTHGYSHSRSASRDHSGINSSSIISPHISQHITTTTGSSQSLIANSETCNNGNKSMDVNCVLSNCSHTPQLSNQSIHDNVLRQQANNASTVIMNSSAFTTSPTNSLPQAPQAYTAAAYDPSMSVSNTTLPPSSLNWSDWDVYIGHRHQNNHHSNTTTINTINTTVHSSNSPIHANHQHLSSSPQHNSNNGIQYS